jgi:hypothetical protein
MMSAVGAMRRRIAGLAAMTLVACATGVSHANAPEWAINPPVDTAAEYWGMGEGYDMDSARRTALRSIAAKLRVSVSGSTDSQTTLRNDAVDRSAQTRVSEVVQETEFSNVTIEKNVKVKDVFYVLVRVDRVAFVRETQAKFDGFNRLAQEALKDVGSLPPIEQYRRMLLALPNIDKALAQGLLLRVADANFSGVEQVKRLEMQKQQAMTAANRLVVSIEHDAPDADVARAITGFLNAQGIRVSASQKALVLRVTTVANDKLLFGNKNHQLVVTVQLVDDKGQTHASKQHRVNGNSMDSFASARQDAMNKLARAMNAAGAAASLGL